MPMFDKMGTSSSLNTVNAANKQSTVAGGGKRSKRNETAVPKKTVVIPRGKHFEVKGAKLGKHTDIYLSPCELGNLELKEYPPVKVIGMVVLEEDKFVIIDELKKIVTYTADSNGQYGKFGTWIEFKSTPKGICKFENDLYIAFSDRTVKHIVMLEQLTEENSFVIDYKCSSIMTYKGGLAVGLENGIITCVDTKGVRLKNIVLPKPDKGIYIPQSLTEAPDGNIMFCDSYSKTVMSVKEDGTVVFTYKGMARPYCAMVDPYRNIILVGEGNNTGETIQLLTDKGHKIKVLKYRKELGMQPYCIANIKETFKIAVCGDSNKIQFYKIDKCRPRTRRELDTQLAR